MRDMAQIRFACGMLGVFVCGALAPDVQAQSPTTLATNVAKPDTLVQAWLQFPSGERVVPPYAYIRAGASDERLSGARSDLMAEYERLRWRLEDGGYADYVRALDAWKQEITSRDTSRVPGNWSAAYLLAHPNHVPDMKRIAAIGACRTPDTVGVWSARGYERVEWRSGLRLSDIYDKAPSLRKGSTGVVAVVDPYGQVDRYGVQAWNYADGEIAPGAQVVGSFPLSGEAFEWLQKAMADYLAHTVSGTECREQSFKGEKRSASADN